MIDGDFVDIKLIQFSLKQPKCVNYVIFNQLRTLASSLDVNAKSMKGTSRFRWKNVLRYSRKYWWLLGMSLKNWVQLPPLWQYTNLTFVTLNTGTPIVKVIVIVGWYGPAPNTRSQCYSPVTYRLLYRFEGVLTPSTSPLGLPSSVQSEYFSWCYSRHPSV